MLINLLELELFRGILLGGTSTHHYAEIYGKEVRVASPYQPETGAVRVYTNVIKNKDRNTGLENLCIIVRDVGSNYLLEIATEPPTDL